MNHHPFFANRVAVLGTMHQKEIAIAPPLETELGLKIIVPDNFNTDIFGTFTRDIKRVGTQIETARLKAEKAIEVTGFKIAIASEGSFIPHPHIPYLPCNREILILLDHENDLEIVAEELSTQTNHSHQIITSVIQAQQFAEKIGFPQHGLVVMLKENPDNQSEIIKGITSEAELIEAVNWGLKNSPTGQVHLETDMRAMHNPTRMQNIAKAAQNLVNKLKSCCPQCGTPGFSITKRIPGLPCAACSAPTLLIQQVIYECQKCQFKSVQNYPDGEEFADPANCMYCNP